MDFSSATSIEYKPINDNDKSSGLSVQRFAAIDRETQQPISVFRWAELMVVEPQRDTFIRQLCQIIRESPFKAVFFETRGVTVSGNSNSSRQKNFEFVLVEAPRLFQFAKKHASSDAFSEYLDGCHGEACQFQNLGGDALLVAPKQHPSISAQVYGHLAAFLRGAPEEQVLAVWKMALQTYHTILQSSDRREPLWFSTSGMGVAWLHFRFDSEPKYYTYGPFSSEEP